MCRGTFDLSMQTKGKRGSIRTNGSVRKIKATTVKFWVLQGENFMIFITESHLESRRQEFQLAVCGRA